MSEGAAERYERDYENMDGGVHEAGKRKDRELNQQPDERTDRLYVVDGETVVDKEDTV